MIDINGKKQVYLFNIVSCDQKICKEVKTQKKCLNVSDFMLALMKNAKFW